MLLFGYISLKNMTIQIFSLKNIFWEICSRNKCFKEQKYKWETFYVFLTWPFTSLSSVRTTIYLKTVALPKKKNIKKSLGYVFIWNKFDACWSVLVKS